MRTQYEKQLKELNTELIEMGSLIETAINTAVEALIEKDVEKADFIKEHDELINRKEKQIEALCFKLLLHQQPVAKDLRLISSALKMITDMERIGDYAEDIAELAKRLSQFDHIYKLKYFKEMGRVCGHMVTECINAFVDKDALKASALAETDDIVDDLFVVVKDELVNVILENRSHSEQAVDLIMIAKYLERIGDHAVNIAEWAIFSITGEKSV